MQKRVARFTVLSLLLAGLVAACFVLVTIERRSTSSVTIATQGLDDVARAYLWTELDEVARVRWITFGVIALLVVIGLSALAPVSEVPSVPEPVGPLSLTIATPPTEAAPERPQVPQPYPEPDLTSIARLCTDFSRLKTTDALPDLLGRSAAALDASGLILWVGAGDRLLPVMAHGYPTDTISRLGPVARTDDSAAAIAWRTGERVTVSGTPGSVGAVVLPLLGVDACLGVLAFEVPHGREYDPVTHAVGALIAAQLATVVPTPPAEGSTEPSASSASESEQESRAQSA